MNPGVMAPPMMTVSVPTANPPPPSITKSISTPALAHLTTRFWHRVLTQREAGPAPATGSQIPSVEHQKCLPAYGEGPVAVSRLEGPCSELARARKPHQRNDQQQSNDQVAKGGRDRSEQCENDHCHISGQAGCESTGKH